MPILLILFMLITAAEGPESAVDWVRDVAKITFALIAIILVIILGIIIL